MGKPGKPTAKDGCATSAPSSPNKHRHIVTYGGRRFLLTVGAGLVCTLLVWAEKISDAIFRDIVIATVAVYIAGNTAQKIKGGSNET